ncbi:hypothetical protein [Psychrobacter cibarius]|uniref:hypothetical protein n=1 Tax=Psychrobacter cibarius TaxID=282669 RepID=UPI001917DC72|nr:hypothetical protein [Psychrobacter cibarius]
MKVDCPYCHASSVCESTDNTDQQAVDQRLSFAIAIPEHDVCKLCQSLSLHLLSLHPLIKVVLSMTLIVAVQYLKSNRGSLLLTQKAYRCEGCNKVFTALYPFV